MADIQKYFEQFHVAIRTDYDISQELRDKRDIVVDRVQRYLKQHSLPGCRVLLQGSYKMKTGVKPIADLEYDIDIGLRFDFRPEDYKAEDVRQWVYEAVKDHTNRCEDRGPCVRVVYEKGFHLDLVIYATWDEGATELYRLAHKTKGWKEADPPALVPHPVLWTQVNATPPGVARAPRGPRSACDTRASRAARSCCTAPRTRSLRRVPP